MAIRSWVRSTCIAQGIRSRLGRMRYEPHQVDGSRSSPVLGGASFLTDSPRGGVPWPALVDLFVAASVVTLAHRALRGRSDCASARRHQLIAGLGVGAAVAYLAVARPWLRHL